MLSDLRMLHQQIFDERSKTLASDALRAYESGALRASIVSLWITVVADLTFKIRAMAESGDPQAGTKIRDLDKAIENSNVDVVQKYESSVLDLACDQLQLISRREKVELSRLNEDRNLCAHPGFVSDNELFEPSAEVVRAHLVTAFKALLIHRPIAGKQLVKTLASEIKSNSWPDGDPELLSNYLQNRYLERTRLTVQTNLITILVKGAIRPPEDNEKVSSRCRLAALSVAEQLPMMFEGVVNTVLENWESSSNLGDDDLLRSASAFGRLSMFWDSLPETALTRLLSLLAQSEANLLLEKRFFSAGIPAHLEAKKIFFDHIENLNAEQIRLCLTDTHECRPFIPRIIEIIRLSGSFREAESNLRLLESCSSDIAPKDLYSLANAIQRNKYDQVRLASGTETILISILADSPKSKAHYEAWTNLYKMLNSAGTEDSNPFYQYDDFGEALRMIQ